MPAGERGVATGPARDACASEVGDAGVDDRAPCVPSRRLVVPSLDRLPCSRELVAARWRCACACCACGRGRALAVCSIVVAGFRLDLGGRVASLATVGSSAQLYGFAGAPPRLFAVNPRTLRPEPGRGAATAGHVFGWSFSPERDRLTAGSDVTAELRLYDLRKLRVLGDVELVKPRSFAAASTSKKSPLTDSNRRPPPYHGGALPTELRGQPAQGSVPAARIQAASIRSNSAVSVYSRNETASPSTTRHACAKGTT